MIVTFVLDCDASGEAAGAVLMQKDEEGKEVVIQYAQLHVSQALSADGQPWKKRHMLWFWAIGTFSAIPPWPSLFGAYRQLSNVVLEACASAKAAALGCSVI